MMNKREIESPVLGLFNPNLISLADQLAQLESSAAGRDLRDPLEISLNSYQKLKLCLHT